METHREVTPEEFQRILNAAKNGITTHDMGQRAFNRDIDLTGHDWTLTESELRRCWNKDHKEIGFVIGWSTKSAGFGELSVWIDKNGKLWADTENMSKDFCKAIFAKLVDSWTQD